MFTFVALLNRLTAQKSGIDCRPYRPVPSIPHLEKLISAEFNQLSMAKVEKKNESANDASVKSIVKALRKRNKYKWFSYRIAGFLFFQNEDSPIRKSYRNTFYCAGWLHQYEGELTTHWCKNRWCAACNRNRMGQLINEWGPRLDQEENLQFMTLTRPNVTADMLADELKEYQRLWRLISGRKWFRRALKAGVIGVRKIECTYNPNRDDYHPHFHLLVSNEEFAWQILRVWEEINLKNGVYVSPQAQLIEPVTDRGGYLEIFKYFTKLIAKRSTKDGTKKEFFDAPHMDVIFRSMAGKKTYFRIGTDAAWGGADIVEDDAAVLTPDMEEKIWTWMDRTDYFGYYEDETGEVLTEMQPPAHLKEILDNSKELEGKE